MSDTPNIPRGPEDLPPKNYIQDIELVILMRDIKSNRVIREERINYSDKDARRWLGKVTYYAVSNGYAIETLNAKDYVVKV